MSLLPGTVRSVLSGTKYAKVFANLELFTIDEAFGGWAKAAAAPLV